MSTLKLDTIASRDGTESTDVTNVINGSAKAWVNFNGTGTVAIRESFNVGSITDNGTGDYTINFTNAMSNTNYAVVASQAYDNNTVSSSNTTNPPVSNNFATGSFRYSTPNAGGTKIDSTYNYIAIYR